MVLIFLLIIIVFIANQSEVRIISSVLPLTNKLQYANQTNCTLQNNNNNKEAKEAIASLAVASGPEIIRFLTNFF